jgi:hypothetical protein
MSLVLTILAVLHVVFGMNFLGSVFILNLVIGPIVLVLPPATVTSFFSKFWPAMSRFLHASIGGTAVFGVLLYAAGSFSSVSGNSAILLDAGIVLGLLAMLEGEVLQIPAVNKLLKQMAPMDSGSQQDFSPAQQKAINRVKAGGLIGTLTISLAVILMVAAAFY